MRKLNPEIKLYQIFSEIAFQIKTMTIGCDYWMTDNIKNHEKKDVS